MEKTQSILLNEYSLNMRLTLMRVSWKDAISRIYYIQRQFKGGKSNIFNMNHKVVIPIHLKWNLSSKIRLLKCLVIPLL